MTDTLGLKAKLGLNVFKPNEHRHITIKPGREKDPRLKRAVLVCPAGLYTVTQADEVELTIDGCLECGTCRIACGTDVLDWDYPREELGYSIDLAR